MDKKRSLLVDFVHYLLVRFIVCFLQMMPLSWGLQFARLLAKFAYFIDKRHRNVAIENLRQAFPGYSEDDLQRLTFAVYEHFSAMVIEIVHLPRMLQVQVWRKYMDLVNGEKVLQAMLSGRGTLVVTGHYGNWEMAGYALGLFGFQTYAIARPLDNPFLDAFVRKFRERTGQRLLAKKGELERVEQILAEGGTIAMLGDQDAGSRGMFVDFFGRPASTHKSIGLLALSHEANVVVAASRRIAHPLQYEIEVADTLDTRTLAKDPNAVRTITQWFTQALERMVRIDPRQYLWLHRRWKHQPAPNRLRKAS